MLKQYYQLIKPRVMYGNLITTVAGFLFATNGVIDWTLFIATTVGTALVISSACVINNYLDQDIDALMARTKKRPLITGEVTGKGAVIFGTTLGITGLLLLSLLTNWWVVGVGVFGWIVYVWLYGALGKRKSVHGTLVGSLSGAAPILAGYVAVTNSLDVTAVLLFLVIFFWQMPEFYSISIFRRDEYAKAKIPVSSVVRGIKATKKQILVYTILTVISALLVSTSELASWSYFIIMLIFSFRWMHLTVEGIMTKNDYEWSKQNFHFSLIYLVVFSVIISLNPWLP